MRDRALPVHGERGRAPAIGARERSAFGGADPKKAKKAVSLASAARRHRHPPSEVSQPARSLHEIRDLQHAQPVPEYPTESYVDVLTAQRLRREYLGAFPDSVDNPRRAPRRGIAAEPAEAELALAKLRGLVN